ncbi:MAG: hypothetical protein M1814_004754 [Vezdaea aestivalis]|nr:MAG: hypothetical protein M1814_004754 [Vezdaea aestivalis]
MAVLNLASVATHLVVFLLFSDQLVGAFGLRQHLKENAQYPSTLEVPERLTSLLNPDLADQSKIFRDAYALLASLEKSPSCNRRAAASLLSSCKSLSVDDGSNPNELERDSSELEDFKSLYAARLAVCEIVGADSSSPKQCLQLLPAPGRGNRQATEYEHAQSRLANDKDWDYGEIRTSHLEGCLRALQSRPQWWTSYSNARQNAAVLCHAARGEIERDQVLDLYRSVTKVTSNINEAMGAGFENAQAHFRSMHSFSQSLEAFNSNLLIDLKRSQKEVGASASRLLDSLASSIRQVMESVSKSGSQLASDLHKLRKDVQQSKMETQELRSNVAKVFANTVKGTSELAASQFRTLENMESSAESLQRSMTLSQESGIKSLMVTFSSIQNQLAASGRLAQTLLDRQTNLETRVVGLDQELLSIANHTELLQRAQLAQAKTYNELHETLRSDISVVHELVGAVSKSAASLKLTIDEASSQAQLLGSLNIGRLIDRLAGWVWVGLVIVGVCLLRNQFSGYVALVIGVPQFLSSFGTTTHLRQWIDGSKIIDRLANDSDWWIFHVTSFCAALITLSALIFLIRKCVNKRTSIGSWKLPSIRLAFQSPTAGKHD